MIEISKELLSEVLGETRVVLDYEISIDNTEIHWGHKDIDEDGFICIYELAHKCKEWAMSKGYMLQSWYKNCICINFTDDLNKNKFYANTEFEAIIKSCQWILDNKSGSSE